MKVKVKYAVIILNYNTLEDSIAAARSVVTHATTEHYIICIADNYSTNVVDRQQLANKKIDHTIFFSIQKNEGYARGNNTAIAYVMEQYAPDYYVIMNPDVKLVKDGTIEAIAEEVGKDNENLVGGQPLVWNVNYGSDPQKQLNIRTVPTFFDVCLLSFLPLRLLFYPRYQKINFLNAQPYNQNIRYTVPSGAFFVIQASFFVEIGMFDPNTFLYYEEYILGFHLQQRKKEMLLLSTYYVEHYQGKSTGQTRFCANFKMEKHGKQAREYYIKHCLKKGEFACAIVNLLGVSDRFLRRIAIRCRCFVKKALRGLQS